MRWEIVERFSWRSCGWYGISNIGERSLWTLIFILFYFILCCMIDGYIRRGREERGLLGDCWEGLFWITAGSCCAPTHTRLVTSYWKSFSFLSFIIVDIVHHPSFIVIHNHHHHHPQRWLLTNQYYITSDDAFVVSSLPSLPPASVLPLPLVIILTTHEATHATAMNASEEERVTVLWELLVILAASMREVWWVDAVVSGAGVVLGVGEDEELAWVLCQYFIFIFIFIGF